MNHSLFILILTYLSENHSNIEHSFIFDLFLSFFEIMSQVDDELFNSSSHSNSSSVFVSDDEKTHSFHSICSDQCDDVETIERVDCCISYDNDGNNGTSVYSPIHSCSSSKSSTKSKSYTRFVVRFNSVEIREYNITVGDNPSCSCGPPISLGWYYHPNEQKELSLDLYEKYRDGKRRAYHQMKIPAAVRHETLKKWHISAREIMNAQTQCAQIKKNRIETIRQVERKDKIENLSLKVKSCFCKNNAVINDGKQFLRQRASV